jgi:hypothetical protein
MLQGHLVFSVVPLRVDSAGDPAQPAEKSEAGERRTGVARAESRPVPVDAHSRLILSVGGAFNGEPRVSDLLGLLARAIDRYRQPAAPNLDHASSQGSSPCRTAPGEAGRTPCGGTVERLHRRMQDKLIDDLGRPQDARKPDDASTRRED